LEVKVSNQPVPTTKQNDKGEKTIRSNRERMQKQEGVKKKMTIVEER